MKKQNILNTTKIAFTGLFFVFAFLLATGSSCTSGNDAGKDGDGEEIPGEEEMAVEDEGIAPIKMLSITPKKPKQTDPFTEAGKESAYGNDGYVWDLGGDGKDDSKLIKLKNYSEYMSTYILGSGISISSSTKKNAGGSIGSVVAKSEPLDEEGMQLLIKLHKTNSNHIEYEITLKDALDVDQVKGLKDRKKRKQEAIEKAFQTFLESYTMYLSNETWNGTKNVKCEKLQVRSKEEQEINKAKGIKGFFNRFSRSKEVFDNVTNSDFAIEQKHLKITNKNKDVKFFVRINKIPKERDGESFGLFMVDKNEKIILSKRICYKTNVIKP